MRRTAVGLAVLLAAACGTQPAGGQADPPPSTAAAPLVPAVPGVAAEAVRLRTDEAVGGRIQVRITHTGGAPYTVTAVALDAPGFAPLPPTEVATEFVPGRVVDLPTPYGEAVCPAGDGPATARLTLLRPDGTVEHVRVALEGEALDRVHGEECGARAVADAVELGVSGPRAGPDRLTARLTLARRGPDARILVERVGGNVQFDVAAEVPLELPAGTGAAEGSLTFTVATCDAHVLAEAKQPHLFPVGVRIGGRPELVVDLPVDEELRAALVELVRQVCRRG
ncbi:MULTISPECIES: hypothetical protein [unclassified Blastococcus]